MSTDNKTMSAAQINAEQFAKAKARKFLTNFMTDTGLLDAMPKIMEFFRDKETSKVLKGGAPRLVPLQESDVTDLYELHFGRWLAMSYALGFMDAQSSRQERRARGLHLVQPEHISDANEIPDELA